MLLSPITFWGLRRGVVFTSTTTTAVRLWTFFLATQSAFEEAISLVPACTLLLLFYFSRAIFHLTRLVSDIFDAVKVFIFWQRRKHFCRNGTIVLAILEKPIINYYIQRMNAIYPINAARGILTVVFLLLQPAH